jgi:IS30 family transposase
VGKLRYNSQLSLSAKKEEHNELHIAYHEERYQISVLLKAGVNQTEIAMILERHKSTISREIARNTGLRGYRPKQAQRLAEVHG